MRRTTASLLCALLLCGAAALMRAADSPKECPPEGDATKKKVQNLNEQKARTDEPGDDDFDDTISMEALVNPGDDQLRWQNGQGAEITAYVIDVRDGGMASSNCHSPDQADHDTLLELVPSPNSFDRAHRVIAVITPQWRRIMAGDRVDWSSRALRAKYLRRWVTIQGWLLFNFEDSAKAVNTAPLPGAALTRATAWEIHPVTSVDLAEDETDEQTILTLPLPQARSNARNSAP